MGLKAFSVFFYKENHVKLHSVHLNDDQDITTAVTVASSIAAVLHMLPCAPHHPLHSCPTAHGLTSAQATATAHKRPRCTLYRPRFFPNLAIGRSENPGEEGGLLKACLFMNVF